MIEGRITRLDLEKRSAVIVEKDGKAYDLKFPERMSIEVVEDETMGMVGGELEDLQEGFEVEVELASQNDDGSFMCDSVICIS